MKNLLIATSLLFSLHAHSTVDVDVLSTEVGFEDYTQKKSLCLLIARVPTNGKIIGVLETIEDCYYTRLALRSEERKIPVNFKKLNKITHKPMRQYLQSLGGHLKFYFSDGE